MQNESLDDYNIRRVGAYRFHTKWADINKNNEYTPIMDAFLDIYNRFHNISKDHDISEEKDQYMDDETNSISKFFNKFLKFF